jgi:hypothetical protein
MFKYLIESGKKPEFGFPEKHVGSFKASGKRQMTFLKPIFFTTNILNLFFYQFSG